MWKISNKHRGIFSLYDTGLVVFFIIAVILAIIFIYVGFSVNDAQKKVVDDALDEVDEKLVVAGKISAAADVSSDKLMVTATPVRTASDGSVNVDSNMISISYKIVHANNKIIEYDNVYAGSIPKRTYNSLSSALDDAKTLNIIETNPLTGLTSTKTVAFIYWITNQNFDNSIDNNELAVLTIVYAKNDMPSSGDQLIIQADTVEGNIMQVEQSVPNISNRLLNFE